MAIRHGSHSSVEQEEEAFNEVADSWSEWHSRPPLRRTPGSRDLRKDDCFDEFKEAFWQESPIRIRRMASNASTISEAPAIPTKSWRRRIVLIPDELEEDEGTYIRENEQEYRHEYFGTYVREDEQEYRQEDSGTYMKEDEQEYRHKDSAVAFHSQFLRTQQRYNFDDSTSSSKENENHNRTISPSSIIRYQIQRPNLHTPDCICMICRHIRHQRRKNSLKLCEKLESCRRIMIQIRDPHDPSNLDRGKVYGYWLKLARLYVKYDTLIDAPIVDVAEEDILFVHYMQAYSAVVRLVEDEREQYIHLFEQPNDKAVAVQPSKANEVDISPTDPDLSSYSIGSCTMRIMKEFAMQGI